MKIAIDARMYGPKQGGLGRYIQQLLKYLEKIDTENQYVVFLTKKNWDEYTPQKPNFKKVLADIHWYGWQEQIKLKKIIKKEKVDLTHFPHWNVPLFYNDPFVVTIHDLLLLSHPSRRASALGPIKYFFKNLAYRIVLKHAAKKSKKIITISEYVKKDIQEKLKIPPEKISVTYLAPFESVKGGHKSGQTEFMNKPYILYVGVAYPHKNLETLAESWKIFNKKYGKNYHLVLVGNKNYFYEKLEEKVKKENIPNIVFTGYVKDEDLPALYQNASLYVFPSLHEGFGLPPLEALQYDLPVCCSDKTSLPEILKSGAIYFNPQDKNNIADTIHQALNNEMLRKMTLAEGKEMLKKYDWKNTAEKTLEIYSDAGGK